MDALKVLLNKLVDCIGRWQAQAVFGCEKRYIFGREGQELL
jgi:hypothetical protein